MSMGVDIWGGYNVLDSSNRRSLARPSLISSLRRRRRGRAPSALARAAAVAKAGNRLF